VFVRWLGGYKLIGLFALIRWLVGWRADLAACVGSNCWVARG
jgi:hypothetical protein